MKVDGNGDSCSRRGRQLLDFVRREMCLVCKDLVIGGVRATSSVFRSMSVSVAEYVNYNEPAEEGAVQWCCKDIGRKWKKSEDRAKHLESRTRRMGKLLGRS